jgi:4,5-DOPA dioxygenase extradiol
MSLPQPNFAESRERMPVLFIGHGSPMNAIEDNAFSRAWAELGKALPRPQAILCVSAHWETSGAQVTAMEKPRTIHDFGGFPRELYAQQYPAPGSPALARLVQETVRSTRVDLDSSWGLDHGAWSVLIRMFPAADIPAVQLSLDRTQPPAYHYALGQALKPLRNRGILILGSGNVVHNLWAARLDDEGGAYDWAREFDETARRLIVSGDHQALVNYDRLGGSARLSIPTNEHYLPLLYVLGLQEPGEDVSFFADRVVYWSLSMRSLRIG